jgi:hypothetical protein
MCKQWTDKESDIAKQIGACSQLFIMNVPGALSTGNSSYFHLSYFLFLSLPFPHAVLTFSQDTTLAHRITGFF